MMKKLLVPVDGSESSNMAVKYACEIAHKFGSEITLLCVIPPPIVLGVEAGVIDYRPLEESGRTVIEKAKRMVESAGLSASTRLETGQVADIIVNIAKEEKTDLIIIGSRGLSGVKRFLLGSVSNRVSHHAPCPVLIVR
ncbi:MAG: universal stress protein [Candidatus Bathyarchaeia archaeon]|nr:universal stress protein [Candidatus Bathyarchaeota archaeon]